MIDYVNELLKMDPGTAFLVTLCFFAVTKTFRTFKQSMVLSVAFGLLLMFAPLYLCSSFITVITFTFGIWMIQEDNVGKRESENPGIPLWEDDSPYVQGGQVTRINGHTIQVDIPSVDRRFRIWKEPDGRPVLQEVDKSGNIIGEKVTSENSWKVGKTDTQDLMKYLRRSIKNGYRVPKRE